MSVTERKYRCRDHSQNFSKNDILRASQKTLGKCTEVTGRLGNYFAEGPTRVPWPVHETPRHQNTVSGMVHP